MTWRKLIIATHRDVGYFFAGLTVIYAISGIAVNHIGDWNPSYVIRTEKRSLGELPAADTDAITEAVLDRMGITARPEVVIRMAPDELRIFFDRRTLTVSLPEGEVTDERSRRRFAIFELNYLHLNHGKGLWTWFADVYALGLMVLACTGIFIVTGRKGLGGRGRWLLGAGILIPLIYLVIVVWM